MGAPIRWDYTAFAGDLSTLPSTVTYVAIGDSSWDDIGGGVGDYDSTTVSAGITCMKNGTEYSAGGTTSWSATPGMDPYICEALLAEASVSAVRGVSEAVTGSRWSVISSTQVDEAIRQLGTQGWAPDVLLIWGMINDIEQGQFVDGTAITAAETTKRLRRAIGPFRAMWPDIAVVLAQPTVNVATYSTADLCRSGFTALAAADAGVALAATWNGTYQGVLNHKDAKHVDQDDATKGCAAAADLFVTAIKAA